MTHHELMCAEAAAQVKSRALRIQLYDAINSIIEHCGTLGMKAAQLDALVDGELQGFCERFEDEPRAAVYVQHIMGYYAPRKGAQGMLLHALCVLPHAYLIVSMCSAGSWSREVCH